MKRLVLMNIPALRVMQKSFSDSAKCVFILLALAVITAGCSQTIPADDENVDESQVSNVNFTPCQQSNVKSAELSSRVNVEFTNEGVQITHYNFEVTFDFNVVDVTHTFVNGVLNITQQGSPNQAKCICYTDVSYTINGISQKEVNVIFINGVQVYCYNDKDDTPQIQVSNVTFTECINTALYLPPAIFTVDFTSLGVNITHYLLDVNCAFETVLVTKTFENGILTITEQGYPNSANCICKANVSYTIEGISEKDIEKIVVNGKVAWTENQQYCDKDVMVYKPYMSFFPSPAAYTIIDAKFEGNCLKIKFCVSGCRLETSMVDLWAVPSIAAIFPPHFGLYLAFNSDLGDCDTIITKEISFNMKELQIQGANSLQFYINDDSGNQKSILYEY